MKYLPLLAVLYCAFTSFSQTDVISSGGNSTNANGNITFSIGQVNYIYSDAEGYSMNEGVQQPLEFITVAVNENSSIILDLSVFPNPTADEINLSVTGNTNEILNYRLFDYQGKLIKENKIEGNSAKINLANLSRAHYFLEVRTDAEMIKTFKIIKQ